MNRAFHDALLSFKYFNEQIIPIKAVCVSHVCELVLFQQKLAVSVIGQGHV